MSNDAGCFTVNGREQICDSATEQVTSIHSIFFPFSNLPDGHIGNWAFKGF